MVKSEAFSGREFLDGGRINWPSEGSMRAPHVVVAIAVLASSVLAAKAEPTLDETVAFIREKVNEEEVASNESKSTVTYDSSRRVLVLQQPPWKFQSKTRIRELHLAKCDPSRVSTEIKTGIRPTPIYVVRVAGTNDQGVLFAHNEGDPVDTKPDPSGVFNAKTSEDSTRLAKSFRHLIKLAGGAKSLF